MAGALRLGAGMTAVRRVMPGALRAHAFLGVIAVGILLGIGLRLVPAGSAATPGSNDAVPVSTACAAS
jgi:hypothetical protein